MAKSKSTVAGLGKEKSELLEVKRLEFKRAYEDFRIELQKQNQQMVQLLLERVNAVLRELSEKNNYRLVVQKDKLFVVYMKEHLDITAQVIEALEKEKLSF